MSKIADELKVFNEQLEKMAAEFSKKQEAANQAIVQKIVTSVRPLLKELSEALGVIPAGIRSAVLADEEIRKTAKLFSVKSSSRGGGQGNRISSKQIQAFTKEAKSAEEITAKFPTVDLSRLEKALKTKKLRLVGNKYQAN